MARYLGPLRRAITRRHKLRLAYTRADGEQSERTVWPLGLFYWGKSWSLAAWCELRAEYRNFRSDRIERVETTGENFMTTVDISLDDFVARMRQACDQVQAGPWVN
jgi:predicted DNA-binding transcriptional regulator YafY